MGRAVTLSKADAGVPRLADFLGCWQIARRIEDRLLATTGAFEGMAEFVPVPEGLAYHEQGMLTLGGAAPLRAERRYLWRAGPDGRIIVDHGDGRPFHAFHPADPAARHLCGADDYAVRYDFGDWPRWRTHWTVRGPRKDYRMVSHYAPVSAGSRDRW